MIFSPKFRQYTLYFAAVLVLSVSVPLIYIQVNEDIVLFRKGEEKFLGGEFEDAADYFQASLDHGNRGLTVLTRLGDSYLALGRFEDALAVYETAGKIVPDNPYLFLKLAHVLSINGETAMALETVDDVLKDFPDWDQAKLIQARILAQDGRFQEAIDIYYQVLE